MMVMVVVVVDGDCEEEKEMKMVVPFVMEKMEVRLKLFFEAEMKVVAELSSLEVEVVGLVEFEVMMVLKKF